MATYDWPNKSMQRCGSGGGRGGGGGGMVTSAFAGWHLYWLLGGHFDCFGLFQLVNILDCVEKQL